MANNLQQENLQKESENLQKSKEHDRNAYEERILNLEHKLENKTLLNLEMQNKLANIENALLEKTETLKQKELEIDNLSARFEKKDKIIQELELKLAQGISLNSDNESFEVLRNLTRELEKLQHETKLLHQAKMKRLVERLQTKESEKSEMMNIFEERLKKMREDYKTACNKIRTGLNSTIDELKEKMAGQNLTIKSLQSENFKFLDQDQEMIRLKYAHDVKICFLY